MSYIEYSEYFTARLKNATHLGICFLGLAVYDGTVMPFIHHQTTKNPVYQLSVSLCLTNDSICICLVANKVYLSCSCASIETFHWTYEQSFWYLFLNPVRERTTILSLEETKEAPT